LPGDLQGPGAITFSCDGDDLVVETAIAGEVRVLVVPLFRREGSYREVWREVAGSPSTAGSRTSAKCTG